MQADYVQILEKLAINGHFVHTFLSTPKTTWNPGISTLKIYPIKDFPLLNRFSILNFLSVKAASCIRKNKINVVYATGTKLGEGLIAGLFTNTPVLCDVRNPWSMQERDLVKGQSKVTKMGRHLRQFRTFTEEKLIHYSTKITAYSK